MAYINIILKNNKNKIRIASVGFSFLACITSMFGLHFIAPIIRRDILFAVIISFGSLLYSYYLFYLVSINRNADMFNMIVYTNIAVSIIFGIFYNKIYFKSILKKNYHIVNIHHTLLERIYSFTLSKNKIYNINDIIQKTNLSLENSIHENFTLDNSPKNHSKIYYKYYLEGFLVSIIVYILVQFLYAIYVKKIFLKL